MSTLIIIPTIEGNEEMLKETLDSLLQNTQGEEYDLVIVKNKRIGFAAAVNRALKNFDAEHIEGVCILNDDLILYPHWLMQLKMHADKEDIIGDLNSGKPDEDHVVFYMSYIKKEVLQKIGLLDENFKKGNWEDVDFCVRAVEAGFKIGKVQDVLCYHKTSQTLGKQMGVTSDTNKEYFKTKWKGTRWENRWN